ncbi:MAG: M15 family metallopeptidase [Ruminococcus sp.]|nr:M15 family metallopeptidase [Ruminococcus sp.]
MKKRRVERYGAVDRTFEIKLDKPVRGLRAVKVFVVVLLAALVVGLIIFGAKLYWADGPDRKTAETDAKIDSAVSEQLLRIVNKTNPLDKDYVPELVEHDGYSVSVLADEQLNAMIEAAKEKGIELSVSSAYISYDEQKKLYTEKYKYNRNKYNLSEVRAQAKTESDVPQAGNSEAQTGLLVTFGTNGRFDGSKASRWLKDNCIGFGFIWRYPTDKTDSTSMDPNQQVYRYVGTDNAQMMRSLNKSLNEYVLYINSR